MSTSHKIQLALGTILLWSSTSVSGLAATNTTTPGKIQSDTVKVSVESIPVRSLNLTQDTYLIAQNYGDLIYRLAWQRDDDDYIPKWEDALKQPDSKKMLLEFCPAQPQDKVENCWDILHMWSVGKEMQVLESERPDWDLLDKLSDISMAVTDVIRQQRNSQ